jgi:nitrogen fixation protein FixH
MMAVYDWSGLYIEEILEARRRFDAKAEERYYTASDRWFG